MQTVRPLVLVVIFVLAGASFGCWSSPHRPVKLEELSGDYVCRSAPGPPQHDPDKLTLKADGTFVLIHMPGGRPGSKEEGKWEVVNTSPHPEVGFGRGLFPIRVKGKQVRLLIDEDLGYWYEKVR